MRIGVSPVENAVQDKADDDDPTIQPGNGNRALKEQTNGEITPLPQVFRQSQLQGCSSLGSPPEGCFALEIIVSKNIQMLHYLRKKSVYLGRPDATLRC